MSQEIIFKMTELPEIIPLLPIRGVILMPRTLLPVPIIDATQASMAAACLQAEKKQIGLVQPSSLLFEGQVLAPLFSTGCLAEIMELGKTEDHTLVMLLKGICRFDILEELAPQDGCRQARVSYASYPTDTVEDADFPLDRKRLLRNLKSYLANHDLKANWKALEKASNDQLLNALSIACPFPAREKQALLESRNPQEQSKMITTLIEMALLDPQMQTEICH